MTYGIKLWSDGTSEIEVEFEWTGLVTIQPASIAPWSPTVKVEKHMLMYQVMLSKHLHDFIYDKT
jgi:hypothetical protein